jgi:hypothetical protein
MGGKVMGDVKNNLQPSTPKAKTVMGKVGDAFGSLAGKRRRPSGLKETTEEKASTLVDHLVEADERLGDLITSKEHDLKSESGQELVNSRKLATLEQMDYHLQRILDLAEGYTKL